MITNIKFLKEVAKRKKYTFISTGMSEYKDIDKAVKIFNEFECPFELMHSISTYPAPENNLNLNIISKLKKRYNCNVGYSGHEPSVSPSVVAVSIGAKLRKTYYIRQIYVWKRSISIFRKRINGFS